MKPLKFEKTTKIRGKLLDKEVKRIMESLGLIPSTGSEVLKFPDYDKYLDEIKIGVDEYEKE